MPYSPPACMSCCAALLNRLASGELTRPGDALPAISSMLALGLMERLQGLLWYSKCCSDSSCSVWGEVLPLAAGVERGVYLGEAAVAEADDAVMMEVQLLFLLLLPRVHRLPLKSCFKAAFPFCQAALPLLLTLRMAGAAPMLLPLQLAAAGSTGRLF